MDVTEELKQLIGQKKNERLEYKVVLPPSRGIAQLISAFANGNGGFIVLGVAEAGGKPTIVGLSEDFHANSITHKAIDLLSPKPDVHYQYVTIDSKRLYVIKVEKSIVVISTEGNVFLRKGDRTVLEQSEKKEYRADGYNRIKLFAQQLDAYREKGTVSKTKFLDHYLSILNIVDDQGKTLYPESPVTSPTHQEGKVLIRILFSSCADNFETYLSELLYEIYLANPNSLKSDQPVTIKEVLDCADIQEFVIYWAKKKLSKLQKGSVMGFISANKQISDLNALNQEQQTEVEKILQIRHLYTHQNGRVDEKFLKYYPGEFNINDEHQMTVAMMLDKLEYLSIIIHEIDRAAVQKHGLSTMN
ncbi:ATP-binding protein [Marivirga lumbricoides]|uniref:ATP-binding protein n=1 Tax=Marivirga lumbricoides TaxID=1046115 RepID=A0A2T4DGE2_9BACT|nr:ATP-binding protein [Marivirga lumbricoides]